MNKLIEKPHLIFLLSIPIIMLIGILSGDAVLDINVHDTYYVIAYLHLTILVSILFGIIGIGYWIMGKADRKLSKRLNWTHVGLTFGGTIIVWILTKFYQTEIMEYEFNNNLTLIITLIILLMIIGQIIFPINIIYGLIKNRKTPFLVSLFICLFSNVLFAQDELPVENTTCYHATYDGNSYYSSIQTHQKLDDSLDEFYAPLTNSINYLKGLYNSRIYMILLIIVWSIYRVYRYSTYKKLTAEQQEYKASTLWIEYLTPFAIIVFLLSGLLVGCDIGFLIHNMLGYRNPEWIDLIIRMIFSIPVGGIIGILLGLFIVRKTRLA